SVDTAPVRGRRAIQRTSPEPSCASHVVLRISPRCQTCDTALRREDTVMPRQTSASSADLYLQRIAELEQALFDFVKATHSGECCSAGRGHRPECIALFEQLGWDDFEQYVAAMAAGMRRPL